MQKIILFFLFLLLSGVGAAQFADQFEDGDFSVNPVWHGDVEKFIVDGGVLRLNDNAAGQAFLATASSLVHDTQWDFWVRLAFTPSSNNHPRIYLVSNSQDLSAPLNGYYLQIGKDGGDNKRLYFYRQDGTEGTEIMVGNTNLATSSNNRLRIRVTRNDQGHWAFFADQTGGHLFSPQGEVIDQVHTSSSWFGVRCLYTVSNANRFYFDDFRVDELIPDTIPPVVEMVQVTSSNALVVHFNKALSSVSAEMVSNYVVDRGVGHPMIASLSKEQPNMVQLLFADHFNANQVYSIRISEVLDVAGNRMVNYEDAFVYYVPQLFDVVFNELMVDPTPEVSLPAHEFIELYNTTDFPVNMEGWVFQHANTRRTLPVSVLPAKGLLLLVTEAAYPFFEDAGHVVAVPGLSGTALTNAGADLLLFDQQDNLISFVSYADTWYQDPARSEGGWSLEKIDPYNLCQGKENWRASVNPRGGTPGLPNSWLAENPDLVPPNLLRAGMEDNHTLVLVFSEPMEVNSLESPLNFVADHGLGQPLSAEALLPDFSKVRLVFGNPIEPDLIYKVVATGLSDCAGNPPVKNTARFGLPQTAAPSDVVINEVLFNPTDNGSRYIELYNRSSNIIDLKDYRIASKDTIGHFLISIQDIVSESYLFFPGEYLVLTTSPDAVLHAYMTPNPESLLRLGGLPRMTNANGVLVFASKSLEEIDLFVYDESMHFPLLTTYKGVSLERLNPDRPSMEKSNWHSAAQNVGFGTPGYKNSQFTLDVETASSQVEVYPEVFSPDGDGHDDLLNISYAYDQPGYVANISIFDSRGRMIRFLNKGVLLGTSGILTWDGMTDDGRKAPVGIYIVHLEVFDLAGNVRNHKKTVVLGGRL